mgnify:FL=1
MLTMLGSPRQFCDRITQPATLQAGSFAPLSGFGLPLLQVEQSRLDQLSNGKATSVISLYLLGR